VLALALAAAVAAATSLAATGNAASTAGSIVGATVPGATTLDVSGCPSMDANRTSFGLVTAGSSTVTGLDCDVLFGSSNSTATLLTYRASPRPTAMAGDPVAVTGTRDAGRILDVDFADASNGLLTMTENGTDRVYRTTDGGVSWSSLATANTALGGGGRGVSYPNTSDVWVCRYSNPRVIATANGGSTWTARSLPGTNARCDYVYATSDTEAWIAGTAEVAGIAQPRIWHWNDVAGTFDVQLDESATTSAFTSIDFAPGTTFGIAVTQNGEIFRTTDGSTWTNMATYGNALLAADAIDANRAVVAGSNGQVYVTTDGGATWPSRFVPDRIAQRDVSARASGVIWVTGDQGTAYRSTDLGLTWSTLGPGPESGSIVGVSALADGTAVITANASTVARTTDAGATWTRSTSPTAGVNWTAVDAADGASAWRVGTGGVIEHTADGDTWTAQASGTTNGLFDVAALDRSTAIAVGSAGTIRRTVDGGATWQPVSGGTTSTLRGVASTPYGHVWIVGDAGTLLRSTDRGATFAPVDSGTTRMLTSVSAASESRVYVGDSVTDVRRSDDAGATWSVLPGAIPNSAVASIESIPGSDRVWSSQGQYLRRSTDAGASWSTYSAGSGQTLFSVSFANATDGWMTTKYGGVRRSTDGGASWTTLSGIDTTRYVTDVVALGPDDALAVAEGDSFGRVAPAAGPPDYGDAGATWGGAAGLFGICLRAAPSTTSTWPKTGSCTASDGTNWRALPDHGAASEAPTASTTAAGTTTASFRFGMKVPASLAPGGYRAPIAFEVVSP
jgi:photosystem II stability/assembly factor-like uncharacterized protein